MLTFQAELNFPLDERRMLERFGLEDHGLVQQAIDKAVIDFCLPYWAWDSGVLAKSAYGASDIGSGIITYPGPYAHYQYMGEVYGPNIPVFEDNTGIPTTFWSPPGQTKHPTGAELNYKTDVNPLAGAFPFERMKADHLSDIVEEAQRVATGK